MRKFIVLSVAIVALALVSGCAEKKRVTIAATPTDQQNSAFMRGGVKLVSKNSKVEVTVVDYSYDEMVITLSIANEQPEPIIFSEKNLTVQHLHLTQEFKAKIYSYEELLAEYGNSNYSTMVQLGKTASSIGSGFIPFGGIAMTLGNLLFSLSEQGVSHEERINSLVSSQLNQLYLRKSTVKFKEEYGGIVKIGFSQELVAGDKVLFNVSIGDKIEKFTFVCQ